MRRHLLLLVAAVIQLAPSSAASSYDPSPDATFEASDDEAIETHRHLRGLQVQNERDVTLIVRNLSYDQPFSTFFIMVHNGQAAPMFELGKKASRGLARLAEYGQPGGLENIYRNINRRGVRSIKRYSPTTRGGQTARIKVRVSRQYPHVSIAAMCENTNDCFVALNGVRVEEGMVRDEPGLDAGSEENNESCDSVPGPACARKGARLQRSGNGEGFVHVHRGVAGGKDLDRELDWRNPMMRVTVE